ncbi:hypothetical protein ADK91_14140, partial [Streptomyces sp. XY511]
MPFPVIPGRRRAPGRAAARPAPGSRSRSGGESGPSPHRSAFRPDIEGLRAVAVVAVLAFHAGIPWATGGFVGVDVFFVI